jgi:hypothetical protein
MPGLTPIPPKLGPVYAGPPRADAASWSSGSSVGAAAGEADWTAEGSSFGVTVVAAPGLTPAPPALGPAGDGDGETGKTSRAKVLSSEGAEGIAACVA